MAQVLFFVSTTDIGTYNYILGKVQTKFPSSSGFTYKTVSYTLDKETQKTTLNSNLSSSGSNCTRVVYLSGEICDDTIASALRTYAVSGRQLWKYDVDTWTQMSW